ncbi:MalY/PatB family protein [Facklamia hominis]|uniref:cysteine-S-conjugate beta-lyase n=1 Tax=Facklamia hominis TaxID=178214 RepID=A0AAJ1V1S0_9LACT|nr:PatB family C-S lyase [Facklamia hominis]MDK7186830.1 PatB family C-S lyase [Facklamia hominis]
MKYDFQTLVDRTEQGSKKWLLMREEKTSIADGVAPLSVADLDFPMAPELIEGLKKELDHFIMGYTVPTKRYYQAVQKWMKEQHNWEIDPEWLVTAPGVVPAISVFIQAFTNEGDGVIIFEPVYNPFRVSIEKNNRKVESVDLINCEGYYTIDFKKFEKVAAQSHTKALIFCSPHNPVGRVWHQDELKQLAEICAKYEITIFCDEIHSDLTHSDYLHIPFEKVSKTAAENVVLATAPSKTFNIAGLMTSNIFIPNPKMREIYRNMAEKLNLLTVPALGILACQIAYEDCAGWKKEFVSLIESNYHLAKSMLEEELPQAIVTKMEASYLLWLDLSSFNLDEASLNALLHEYDLFVTNGQVFSQHCTNFIRIHLALPQKVVEASINRLISALKSI